MGFNTTVVVMNDALDMIRNDPQFGARLAEAVMLVQRGQPVDVAAHSTKGGIHCNAATVIETHHADYFVTVRVGMNYGEVVLDIPKTPKRIPKSTTGRNLSTATR